MFPDFLGQWFPTLPLYQHHLGSIIKYSFSVFPSHLWFQNLLGWGLEIWILKMSQGESDAPLSFGHPILGNNNGNANTQHLSFSLLAGIRLTVHTVGPDLQPWRPFRSAQADPQNGTGGLGCGCGRSSSAWLDGFVSSVLQTRITRIL